MEEKKKFETLDWVLFGGMLAISSAIGIFYAIKDYCSKKSGDSSEFLMGGRHMKLLPVAISILVSFISAILILGTPAEMYTAGTLYILNLLGVIIAVILSSVIFVPLFYPLKLTSTFEYLELRFKSKAAKLTGTFIMVIQQVVYMGIASFAPSTALEAVTGFPTWATIITVGCVSTFYTFLGGMKASVWSSVFQAVIMVAGMLAIVIKGAMEVGGMGEVWRQNEEWDRIEFWEAHTDPTVRHSVWSLVVGGMMLWLGTYGCNQASVQRYCAVATIRDSRLAMLLNVPGVVILVVVAALAGVVMFGYYAKIGCDPLTDGQVSNPNQLIPLFVMDVLGIPGLPGLFISCLFSGALSTMSSCLSALSAVTWEDVLKPLIGDKVTETQTAWITKILVVVYGGAGIGFSFVAANLGGTVLQASLSFTGSASGPLLGIFLLGGFFPWANWKGCVAGGIIGLAFPMWISIGAYSLPSSGYELDFPTANCSSSIVNGSMTTVAMTTATTVATAQDEISGIQLLYTVSYLWLSAIGTGTAVVVGLIVSLLTGPMGTHETDPKYLIPLFDRLFCCLPERLLSKLRCNMDFKDPKDIEKDDEKPVKTNDVELENGVSGLTLPPQFQHGGIAPMSYKPRQDAKFVYDNDRMFLDDNHYQQSFRQPYNNVSL